MMTSPTYFITFSTYGAWLHGDDRGSVDRNHNLPGEPWVEPNARLQHYRQDLMTNEPYVLDEIRRGIVLEAVLQHAEYRNWTMLAAHTRTRHVHMVIAGPALPTRMMDEFKAYASRALNAAQCDPVGCKRWARHGSTRFLNTDESITRAIRYTVDEQGTMMAVYERSQTDMAR